MNAASQHFAEDPELLEEFVLGRLDRTSIEQCTEHLRTCDACREAVDEERRIAAGVRRYGRDQLKERLRAQAIEPPARKVPWPHVLSAAAVLLILIGIGITRHWFTARVGPVENVETEGPPKELNIERAAPEMRNEPLTVQKPSPSSPESSPGSSNAGKMQQQDETKAKEPDKDVASAPAPADRVEPMMSAEGKGGRMNAMSRSSVESNGRSREYWITGTVTVRSDAGKQTPAGQISKKELKEGAPAATAPGGTGNLPGEIILEQRPASELSARSRNQRQTPGQLAIPTLMQQTDIRTRLILFPAVPFDSTQFLGARIERVAADSLLISIGNQLIGYRLPAGGFAPTQPDSSQPGQK